MIEESHFETFLYISKNKYQIFVQDKDNLKNIFNEEIEVDDQIELDNLSKFLDDNIYKIEKVVNRFIRNIILIIENEKILSIDISIKKNNYEKNTSQKYFETNLIEVKDIFKESYHDQIIMHMVIINKDKNNNIHLALNLALEFLNNENFKNKIIDARIKNQIILND